MSRVLPAVLDALVVVVFAAVGRRSHSEGVDVLGVLRTAVPFLVGTAGGWVLAGLALDTGPRSLAWGAVVLVATVAVGMLVRAITGQGVALSFVVVATLVLGLLLLGWRVLARLLPG
ncbi:DUF3054 domain-containing protein [Phycicoccus endophyticus]|uniref:DUF3054 domain-containing protein n=1 Tax=Phycicoccus endophyticus TaxID=1690220 RepID=UPI00140E0785|nr:DUF3054 domain-containing protein [Phycicoccus endophyticus]NHI18401.1 DUF3054 domain-containing protein [Phycicoccus endophyticus]GGL24106.1 membrane protein [Phycicoccus endophyticus]